MKKICLVIDTLEFGGAEKVLVQMANYLANKKYKITTITLFKPSKEELYLSDDVEILRLNLLKKKRNLVSSIMSNIKIVFTLGNAINREKPDYIISFLAKTNLYTILTNFIRRTPHIITVHTILEKHSIGKVWDIMYKIFYRFADVLVVPSKYAVATEKKYHKNIISIPNPIGIEKKISDSEYEYFLRNFKNKYKNLLISVGRFVPVKQFDLLIDIFEELSKEFDEWGLVLVGDGEQRSKIEHFIEKKNLNHRVFLSGFVDNPSMYISSADLFVMTSKYEGFGNVLIESLNVGVPVVSFDCDVGPREIIKDGVNGVLVPPGDKQRMISVLRDVMSSEQKRIKYKEKAQNSVREYSLGTVMNRWLTILNSL